MNHWTRVAVCAVVVGLCGAGCSKDDRSQAEKDAEVKRVLQEGAAKEQKMYEGMQKGVEDIEKKAQDQKDKK